MRSATRLAVVGAAGRMGREIVRAATLDDTFRIVAALEHATHPELGRDAGELAATRGLGLPLGADLAVAFPAADVIIDLSSVEATAAVIAAARRARRPLLIGTTGLDAALHAACDEAAKEIPLLVAANLSLGVAVLTRLVEQAVAALGPDYDVEIVEAHHRHKADAPSGTALALAAAAQRGRADLDELLHGRFGRPGARHPGELGLHAVRGGGIVGDHTVILAGSHERLELIHRAGDRAVFAQGALRAARFLALQPPGRYTMSDVIQGERPPTA